MGKQEEVLAYVDDCLKIIDCVCSLGDRWYPPMGCEETDEAKMDYYRYYKKLADTLEENDDLLDALINDAVSLVWFLQGVWRRYPKLEPNEEESGLDRQGVYHRCVVGFDEERKPIYATIDFPDAIEKLWNKPIEEMKGINTFRSFVNKYFDEEERTWSVLRTEAGEIQYVDYYEEAYRDILNRIKERAGKDDQFVEQLWQFVQDEEWEADIDYIQKLFKPFVNVHSYIAVQEPGRAFSAKKQVEVNG
jgi:hypothetical protein